MSIHYPSIKYQTAYLVAENSPQKDISITTQRSHSIKLNKDLSMQKNYAT